MGVNKIKTFGLIDFLNWSRSYQVSILIVLINTILLFGLNAQDFKGDYKVAKDFYDEKKYNFSMDAFRSLMVYDRDNPYVEYSTFYYALSAYHQNYFSVTKEALLQIKNLYPEWNQMDEVDYWLAQTYFQQGELFQALRLLYSMKSPRDLSSIERMKNYYLLQLNDDEVIRLLLEEFPGEIALVKRWITRKLARREYEKAREIIAQYGLDEDDFYFPKRFREIKKDKYRIAALFPFVTELLDPSPGAKLNQSTLDLYQGMLLAADSLNNTDLNLEFVGYDTERKTEKVTQLMEMEEMKSTDVFMGPLFLDELQPVKEFSKNYSVPVVNPITNSPEYIEDNTNALLLQPDYNRIGEAIAEFIAKKNYRRPCVVISGETPRDSILTTAFLRKAKELNVKIAFTKYIYNNATPEVYSTLASPTKYDKFKYPSEYTVKKDSIGSVFVASDNELIFTKVISSIDRRADSVVIVGSDSWLTKPGMDLDKFERLGIVMSSSEYVDMYTPEYKNFVKSYISKFGTLPSSYAQRGYESMLFLGNSLHEYGLEFISKLQDQLSLAGPFQKLYNFSNSQCNKEVSFVSFRYGELVNLY